MQGPDITTHARSLRKNQTEFEKILWELLRNRKFRGLKFYRQRPLFFNEFRGGYYYIADFYCAEKMVIIELDGQGHNYQKEYDKARDEELQELKGIRVLRIWNRELEQKDLVLKKIEAFIFGG